MPVFWLGWLAFVVGGAFVKGLYMSSCALVALIVTPKSHRRYGHYDASKAAKELRDDRYEITPDFSMDAVAKIKKS